MSIAPAVRTPDHCITRIRGQSVILDADLAALYGVTPKRLNEQVRRNKKRFPDAFMFQITDPEWDILRSQIATSNASCFEIWRMGKIRESRQKQAKTLEKRQRATGIEPV